MFERISGFFKQFTRRRKRQSGETTIMDAKEPGADEFGLDEGFGELDSLDEGADTGGFSPAGTETEPKVSEGFSDFDLGTEEPDITTGASDFDERTVSDEISGPETGLAEAEAELAGTFPDEAEAAPFAEAMAEPKPGSPLKGILIFIIVAVVAIGVGGAFQIFLWPAVGGMIGVAGANEPKLDVQTEVNSAKRVKAKLEKELREFRAIGGPAEVKGLQEELIQVRDAQGTMEEFGTTHTRAKEKGASYDTLLARIKEIGSEISKTRGEIDIVRSEIEETRERVVELAKQSEEEYERFRLELVRAELSQRLLIELQMQDIESFRAQVAELERQLSRLTPPDLPAPSSETATPPEVSGADALVD